MVAELPRYSRATGLDQVRWRASSNESTMPPSPRIQHAISEAATHAHLYPSPQGDGLIADLSARLEVSPQHIVVGGGSLALLQHTLTAYTGAGTQVVHAWRSYEAYPILIGIAGAVAVPVKLDAIYAHDVDAMLAATTQATRAIIVCNPNNPTGTELPRSEIERLITSVPANVLVLLDEAYHEFATADVDGLSLVRLYPNVVIFRTFSKAYGLAGLRAGYMIAHPEVADNVRVTAPPFGLSLLAEAGARAAWADTAHTDHIVNVVRQGREYLRGEAAKRGLPTPVSGANFVWFPVGSRAAELQDACVAQGVSVRAFDDEGVRVTVGNRDAEDAVLAAIDSLQRASTGATTHPQGAAGWGGEVSNQS
ncbi:aminotransferase class I/II-fold pyridoxal phosphate-dependent enzyme [Mycobacteroides abscessus]|nr:aminotransferase class I/II-fold pyridoxal phosphate-dependent enzyme [Mycobacteroides abscessus]SHR30842.1 Putative phenylalanine aminotransferase [Mycobacteroides abscessus subsp. bolletii]SHT32804.1 Putative phenylalanine aminotransferase [Mycobacteroides abscessus subsp. bolletii]SHT51044.1 Putative phenylalanine aminotransferase [Mycobacteroides abscessus subsp. bolletii]SKG64140.1 Putative phenylalanine aminotransferase [Mycobacteroides abscessus subsp. bolletii]SKH19374.1 Putative ph